MAKETNVSKGKASLELVRKMNERSRYIQKWRPQKERLRKMAKDLEITEAHIQLVDGDIKRLSLWWKRRQMVKTSKQPCLFSCYNHSLRR